MKTVKFSVKKQLSEYFNLNKTTDLDKCSLYCDLALSIKDLVADLRYRYSITEEEMINKLFVSNESTIECVTIRIPSVFRDKGSVSEDKLFVTGFLVLQPKHKPILTLSYTSYCTKIEDVKDDEGNSIYTEAEINQYKESRKIIFRYEHYFNSINKDIFDVLYPIYKYLVLGQNEYKEEAENILNSFKLEDINKEEKYFLQKNSKSKINNTNASKTYVLKNDESKTFNGLQEAYNYCKENIEGFKVAFSTFQRKGIWKEYFSK